VTFGATAVTFLVNCRSVFTLRVAILPPPTTTMFLSVRSTNMGKYLLFFIQSLQSGNTLPERLLIQTVPQAEDQLIDHFACGRVHCLKQLPAVRFFHGCVSQYFIHAEIQILHSVRPDLLYPRDQISSVQPLEEFIHLILHNARRLIQTLLLLRRESLRAETVHIVQLYSVYFSDRRLNIPRNRQIQEQQRFADIKLFKLFLLEGIIGTGRSAHRQIAFREKIQSLTVIDTAASGRDLYDPASVLAYRNRNLSSGFFKSLRRDLSHFPVP